MKFLVFLLTINLSLTVCSVQIVDIPDPVFKWGLVNLPVADLDGNGTFESDVDTNDDGEIQESEAEAVFGLEVAAYTHGGSNIQSLEGLEAFVNIEFLNCSQQEISIMDLTSLANLRELDCDSNLLTSMDVTQNTLLEVLGEFGEYLSQNCQIGVYSPFLNADLHNFLSEQESIPNQHQYKKMKEKIMQPKPYNL